MKDYSYENGITFKRVTKRVARVAYNKGLRVVLCPCNLRPGAPWHPEVSISGKADCDFETALNAFEYYNRNHETGYYTAFYIPVKSEDAAEDF